jgi:nucleoid-associated protein YgaU
MVGQTSSKPARAYLQLITPNVVGKKVSKGGDLERIQFLFNPKEYTAQKTAKWDRKSAKKASSAATPEFGGSEPTKISLELFLDAYASQESIHNTVALLLKAVKPLPDTIKKGHPIPPLVIFGWGRTSFPAVVQSVQVKYTMFDSAGTPTRAVATVALEEFPLEGVPQNPTSSAPTTLRSHDVISGDTLASIAFEQYGDPAKWRLVAEANGIDDPLRLRPGMTLIIPAPEEEPVPVTAR